MPSTKQASSDPDVRAKLIDALQPLLDALIKAMNSEHTPEMAALRTMFLRRLVFSGDVIPSRIPPPSNITELGGYLNFLRDSNQSEMAIGTVASALGLAVPLSDKEKDAMAAQSPCDPRKLLKSALTSTAGWVAVCNTEHDFWSGEVSPAFIAARSAATSHDESVHNGRNTAAVLSL